MIHHKIEEISIGGILHDGVGYLLGAAFGNGLSFVLNVMSSDNIGVVDKRKSGFVLEISMGLVSSVREDFHSIVVFVDLGVNQVNWEFGFVQGLDYTNVSEDVIGLSACQCIIRKLAFRESVYI